MKTIHKNELLREAEKEIKTRAGAPFITAQMQRGVICLWAMLEDSGRNVSRRIFIVGTGQDVPSNLGFIGTVQDGLFVWHIFDGGEIRG